MGRCTILRLRCAPLRTGLHGDHLGSTNVVSGAAISQQTYYAYGLPRTSEGTLPTDYAFTGQRQDASDGLLYYGARYYEASLNRWIQPDTIVPDWYNPQSLNRYSYTLNNPVKYRDPSGHMECESEECDEGRTNERSIFLKEISDYGAYATGKFSKAELEEVKTVLDAYGSYIGKNRFAELLGSGIRFAHPDNTMLNIHRTSDDVPVGWVDSQQAILLPDATFNPVHNPFRQYVYTGIVPDEGDIPDVLIGHEIGHIIRDGLVRRNGVDLTSLYANQIGDGPFFVGAGPNENVVTAIAMGALTQAGFPAGRDYTPAVHDFMELVALPYLTFGHISQLRGAFP